MEHLATHLEHLRPALLHLSLADPVMERLIREIGPVPYETGGQLYPALVRSVIYQVVSTAAGDTVVRRLNARTEGKILPEVLAKINQEEFRLLGIGAQKYHRLAAMTQCFIDDPAHYEQVHTLSDYEALQLLIALPGIGKWTAQMVLMFCLGREDIFAPDDLGLQNAMTRLYDWPAPPKRKDLERKAADWAPYRSLASVYLWNSIKRWEETPI
jgi:DNA-3-methyladenine glycosylase II